MEKNHTNWRKWFGAFLFAVAVIIVYKTFDNLGSIFSALGKILSLFTPFVIGFILAFFLYPATVKLEQAISKTKKGWLLKRKKGISILVVYFVFLALLVLAFSFILPAISDSVADFVKRVPEYIKELETFSENLTKEGGLLHRFRVDDIIDNINVAKILQQIVMQDVWSYVEGVKGVTNVLFEWVMGIVICAYALFEKETLFRIVRFIFGLFVKKKTLTAMGKYVHKISGIFYQFFFGKMIDSLIIGIMALIGFLILGAPYAALMAVIVMVFNMIPYFGPFIGAVPPVLVTLLVQGIYPAIWIALFIFLLQQFDGIVLGPKILGDSVGVSPFWVIFAIMIFGGWFGISGMIFGVPLIAAIRMLTTDLLDDAKMNMSASAVPKKPEAEE